MKEESIVEKKISVIVPIYNVAQYLEKCLKSIINQTYQNLEIILVDDGSTDDSADLCDIYAKKDKRIKVIHKKNGGLSDARNVGIDSATGEYLAFIDSDDWIDNTMFEEMEKKIEQENVDIVICNVVHWDGKNNDMQPGGVIKHEQRIQQGEMFRKLCQNQTFLYVIACNKLYRSSIFNDIRYPKDYIHEDAAVIHQIYDKCQSVLLIPEFFYYYRQHNESIMGEGFSVKRIDWLVALADRATFFKKKKLKDCEQYSLIKYDQILWKLISDVPNFYKNRKYNNRLKKSIRMVIIAMVKSGKIRVSHKFYMLVMMFSTRTNIQINKSIRKIKGEKNNE